MPDSPKRRHRRFWIAVGCTAAAVVFAWAYLTKGFGLAAGPPLARTSMVVLGFENRSGSLDTARLSEAFTMGLAGELGIGRELRVVSGEQAARLRLELKLNATDSYPARVLSRIRENTGADFVLYGRYSTDTAPGQNGPIRLNIVVLGAKSGNIAASIQRSGNANDVGALVLASANEIRAKLHLPELPNAEQRFTRTVLPSSSEALALYAAGLEDLYTWKYQEACRLFEKAIASDPSYALAHAGLARALWERGYLQRAIAEIRDALNLSRELPREQWLLVESEYYEIESEPSKALDANRTLFKLYPDNIDYGLSVARLQSGTEALGTLDALRRLPVPLGADPRIDALKAKIEIGLHDYSAARLAAEAAVIKSRERSAQVVLADALLTQGQTERMLAQRPRAAALYHQAESISGRLGDHGTETECMRSLADIDLEAGELTVAGKSYSQALDVGRSVGSLRIVASSAAGLGHVRLEQGNLAQAERFLEQSIDLLRNQESYVDIPIQETHLAELFLRRGELQKSSEFIGDALNTLKNTRGRPEVEALAVLARMRLVQGNLESASEMVNEARQISKELSDKYPLARILLAAGRLAREKAAFSQARQQYGKAVVIFSKLGVSAGIAEARLGLAQLDLAEHNAPAAASLAHETTVEFEREGRMSSALAARAIEAEADVMENRIAAAEAALRPALKQRIQDRLAADLVHIVAARVQAARGRRARAIAELNSVIADTSRLGLVRDRLEAELAFAAIEPSFNTSHLISEATHDGFTQIANRAKALRPADDARARTFIF
jgi:tetratricopeptide (TPR) repeat protein